MCISIVLLSQSYYCHCTCICIILSHLYLHYVTATSHYCHHHLCIYASCYFHHRIIIIIPVSALCYCHHCIITSNLYLYTMLFSPYIIIIISVATLSLPPSHNCHHILSMYCIISTLTLLSSYMYLHHIIATIIIIIAIIHVCTTK